MTPEPLKVFTRTVATAVGGVVGVTAGIYLSGFLILEIRVLPGRIMNVQKVLAALPEANKNCEPHEFQMKSPGKYKKRCLSFEDTINESWKHFTMPYWEILWLYAPRPLVDPMKRN